MNKSERALDFLFLGLQQDTLLQLFLVSLLCKQNQSISQLRPMGNLEIRKRREGVWPYHMPCCRLLMKLICYNVCMP